MGPLRIGKIGSFRIGKTMTLPEWQKYVPSGLAKTGPFRIGTLPVWQIQDPSGLAKIGPS